MYIFLVLRAMICNYNILIARNVIGNNVFKSTTWTFKMFSFGNLIFTISPHKEVKKQLSINVHGQLEQLHIMKMLADAR